MKTNADKPTDSFNKFESKLWTKKHKFKKVSYISPAKYIYLWIGSFKLSSAWILKDSGQGSVVLEEWRIITAGISLDKIKHNFATKKPE